MIFILNYNYYNIISFIDIRWKYYNGFALSLPSFFLSLTMARDPRFNLNNGGARFNRNDQVALAQHKASCAKSHYGYAFRAFNKALKAVGVAGFSGSNDVNGAREALDSASQALNRANSEVTRQEMVRRFRQSKLLWGNWVNCMEGLPSCLSGMGLIFRTDNRNSG